MHVTFKEIFPALSRTKVTFQDIPGPGNFKKKPGLSRRRGNHVSCGIKYSTHDVYLTLIIVREPRCSNLDYIRQAISLATCRLSKIRILLLIIF